MTYNIRISNITSVSIASIAFSLLTILSIHDYMTETLLAENFSGLQDFSYYRSILLGIISFSLIYPILRYKLPNPISDSSSFLTVGDDYYFDDDTNAYNSIDSPRKLAILGVLSLSALFIFIFIYSPRLFNYLCLENNPIELFSAAFWFLAFGLFIGTFVLFRKLPGHIRNIYLTISFSLAIVSFLAGIEEISWTQSFFHFKSPAFFRTNIQGEVNLHNFSTHRLENMFYFSTFLFLVLIPFINDKIHIYKKYPVLFFFLPSRFIVLMTAIAFSYNFSTWNIIFIQLSFFITTIILIHYFFEFHQGKDTRIFLGTLFVCFILNQIIFLKYGHNSIRCFDVKEYKEFFIALSFLVYALEVMTRSKHTVPKIKYVSNNNLKSRFAKKR